MSEGGDTLRSLQYDPERYNPKSSRTQFGQYDPARYLAKASDRFEFTAAARAMEGKARHHQSEGYPRDSPRDISPGPTPRSTTQSPIPTPRSTTQSPMPRAPPRRMPTPPPVRFSTPPPIRASTPSHQVSSAVNTPSSVLGTTPMKESFWEAVQENNTPSASLERSFSDFVGSSPKKAKRKDPPRSLATRAFQKDARDGAILNRAVQWGRDQKVKEESVVEEMEQLETQLLLALHVLRIYTIAQATFEIPVCLLYLSVCLLSPFIRGLLCDIFLALTSFMLTPQRQFDQKKTKQLLSGVGVAAGVSVFNCCTQVADGVVMMFTVEDTFTCRCQLKYEGFCLGIERYLPFLHLLYIPLLLVILKQRSRLQSMLGRHDELTLALQNLRDQRLSQEMAFLSEKV